jgi:hypothetical protein
MGGEKFQNLASDNYLSPHIFRHQPFLPIPKSSPLMRHSTLIPWSEFGWFGIGLDCAQIEVASCDRCKESVAF